ncbi:MAG: transketolase C-terminal domain-containing protein, partial [Acetobacter sp.]
GGGEPTGFNRIWGPHGGFHPPFPPPPIGGGAGGAPATGLRPVAELMFVDFVGSCLDQIMNQAAKFRYMFGGKARTPLVIRAMYGAGFNAAAQHSQALYPLFTHIPGLKVVVPSSPYEAKGLLIEAIRDDDPVIFLENKVMYDDEEEVPDEPYSIPFGEANLTREGDDVTIVAFGRMVNFANEAADRLGKDGISCTVIDPRTTSPLDSATILECVEDTGRLVIVDESSPRCNMATDVAALVAEQAFDALRAPIRQVVPPHTPVPFATVLEKLYLPDAARIESAVRSVMAYKKAKQDA